MLLLLALSRAGRQRSRRVTEPLQQISAPALLLVIVGGAVQGIVQPSYHQMLSHQSFPPHLLLVLQRCEKWFCWQVWRGRPAADEPRASLMHPLLMRPCHVLPLCAAALPCCAALCQGRAAPAASKDWSSSSGPGSWAVLVAGPCSALCASRTLPA